MICHFPARKHLSAGEWFLPAGLPQSGKLPVLNLLTGQKSTFCPAGVTRCTDSREIWAQPSGTWVRLVEQNFMPIGARGLERGPKNVKNFHFLVKSRPAEVNPLIDFYNAQQCFTFEMIRFTGYGVIAEKPRVSHLPVSRIFPCTL